MKKLILLSFVLIAVSCSKSETLTVEPGMLFAAKDKHDDSIASTFYIFKTGDYDPTTFEYKLNMASIWESATIKTNSGETARSIYIDIFLANGSGYGDYECRPGDYYVVAEARSKGRYGSIWMTKTVSVGKTGKTLVCPIFNDLYTLGYTEWVE